MKFTPSQIHQLGPNQIFVFGSNTQGRHGAGAARQAMKFGAIYGQPRGRQGQTYAIVTKDLSLGRRSIPLEVIYEEINNFVSYAIVHPELEFLVTAIGCGLAGYSVEEMSTPFQLLSNLPVNIILPKGWLDESYDAQFKAWEEERLGRYGY
jgi:hypothetical protein